MFTTLSKDKAVTTVVIQGAQAQYNVGEIAQIVFRNFDNDTAIVYPMAQIGMMDSFGTSNMNGFGSLVFRTNQLGTASNNALIPAMIIDHQGFVGIGRDIKPTRPLHVNGRALFNSNVTFLADLSLKDLTMSASNDGTLWLKHPSLSNSQKLGAFGSFYKIAETYTYTATTSDVWQTKLVLTSELVPAGKYRFTACYQVFNNTGLSHPVNVRAFTDSTDIATSRIWHDASINVQTTDGVYGSEVYHAFDVVTAVMPTQFNTYLQYASPTQNLMGLYTSKLEMFRIE